MSRAQPGLQQGHPQFRLLIYGGCLVTLYGASTDLGDTGNYVTVSL